MAQFAHFKLPELRNEPFQHFQPGSPERAMLKEALAKLRAAPPFDVPVIVNGKEIREGVEKQQVFPTDHKHVLCTFHQATKETIESAISGAMEAKKAWEAMPFEDRAAIFLRAAELLSKKYRYEVLAALMLGQGKNPWQAEIDGSVELIDFWRFGIRFASEIYAMQPPENAPGTWNRLEYRPLEGFILAITPFNFLAIGGNLPTAPAMMGNVALWKPASTAVYASYLVFKLLQEAGVPPGVIQFLPSAGSVISEVALNSPHFSGLHFTGSTEVFNSIWLRAAQNIKKYVMYPRIVGETGGKDFHAVHKSADVEVVVANTLRGAFEYQGQKCSACSRCFFPDNISAAIETRMVEECKKITMGQPDDFSVFMTAVIDKASFDNLKGAIEKAKKDPECTILTGGKCDDSVGYFVEPTIIKVSSPHHSLIKEELFGPVLTVYTYPADKWEETLEHLVDKGSQYALTGAIFANDREAVVSGTRVLRHAAGNFYINDKCTGAVVGQQPFGGMRASGTNDKAGSVFNLLRWVSPRTIKEVLLPVTTWDYPHMKPE